MKASRLGGGRSGAGTALATRADDRSVLLAPPSARAHNLINAQKTDLLCRVEKIIGCR